MPAENGACDSEEEKKYDEGNDDEEDGGELAQKQRSKEATRGNVGRLAARRNVATSKWCKGCLQDKELDDYHTQSRGVSGRQARCKVCLNRDERKRTREKAGRSEINTAVEAVKRNQLRLAEEEDTMT